MNSTEENPSIQEPKREIYCPPALRPMRSWLGWIFVRGHDGNDRKIPVDKYGNTSGSTRVEDYCKFGEIIEAGRNPGFCLTADDDFVGIDLDNCIVDGKLLPWADQICEAFKETYIELSPSGTGVHILCLGKKAANVRSQIRAAELSWTSPDEVGGIEVYEDGRFFTWTGFRVPEAGDDVIDMQPQIDWICEEFLPQKNNQPTAVVQASGTLVSAGGGGSAAEKRAQAYADAVPPAHEGGRNTACFKLAGNLMAIPQLHSDFARQLVLDFAARCVPPFSPQEARECLASAIKKNGTPPPPKEDRPMPVETFTPEEDAAFEEFSQSCLNHRIVDGMSQPKGAANDLGWTPSVEFLEQFGIDFNHPQLADFIKALVEGGSISLRGSGRPKKYIFEAPDPEKGFHEDFAKWTSSILPLERSPVERLQQYPAMKPIIIDGLLRETEILNVIAAPKVGKSWFALQMAVSVALGIDFLGRPTQQQKVFILDNELHPETAVDRLELMCQKMGISPADLDGKLVVDNLRGSLSPLDELVDYFLELQGYGLIVLDALYRLLPRGISENDNAAMTEVYNMLDSYAACTNAAICCIHHTSKGDQSTKSTTDIGSGAGSQSRAADSHLTMLPHEIEDCVVLGGVVRSFSGFTPLTLKREFPTWIDKPMIAADVKKPEGAKAKVDTNERDEAVFQILRKVGKPSTANQLYENKGSASIGKSSISASLADLAEQGDVTVEESEVKGRKRSLYSLQSSAANHETLADYRNEKWDIQC